jgi:hypothetical protein
MFVRVGHNNTSTSSKKSGVKIKPKGSSLVTSNASVYQKEN